MDKLEALNPDLKDITRLTVVDENGRSYEKFNIVSADYDLQDDGFTLKIFLKTDQSPKH